MTSAFEDGYSAGMISAVEAFIRDLAERGQVPAGACHDGPGLTCMTCTLDELRLGHLALRFRLARDHVLSQHGGSRPGRPPHPEDEP